MESEAVKYLSINPHLRLRNLANRGHKIVLLKCPQIFDPLIADT